MKTSILALISTIILLLVLGVLSHYFEAPRMPGWAGVLLYLLLKIDIEASAKRG